MEKSGASASQYWRYPARVLGCLRAEELTVIFCPGVGLADGGVEAGLPMHRIPFDLRMPNSEFDVLCEQTTGNFVRVLRKGEIFSEPC